MTSIYPFFRGRVKEFQKRAFVELWNRVSFGAGVADGMVTHGVLRRVWGHQDADILLFTLTSKK